jgi:hypothetical protein
VHAYTDIQINSPIIVGLTLPKDLAKQVIKHALVAEVIPSDPWRYGVKNGGEDGDAQKTLKMPWLDE